MSDGRYFFALWPDEAVREKLAAINRQMLSKGRPHQSADLHMTLVFLGQVADSRQRCIVDAADAIVGSTFTLHLDQTGYWPRPRILWAGSERTPEPLSQLVFDLKNNLTTCGFEPERRKYKPHVTLHRKAVRSRSGVIAPTIEWRVEEFVLAVSGGGQKGAPRYRVLQRWPLSRGDESTSDGAAGPHPTGDGNV
ncbi:MAG: RNA 2',3'-cyclic phosphodiesterase [Candidatus Thiodiazotropha sp. (ex Monitilora ramsayi)]|nr:RNA 2',3'-cyclic phosphodiesterase [Candidatus Thiodiazotropha sp. (ex Monitilora ramsayi)]